VDPGPALAYARRHRPRLAEDVGAFVRFPSVSSDPSRRADVARCASWLAGRLRAIGFDRVGAIGTRGHPVVIAEWRRRPGRPTLLMYGHYDVQPAGRGGDWRTPPFRAVRIDDDLYGRGASDDKGPVTAHLFALESWLRGAGRLPVNVRCVFDGEEEVGSPGLAAVLRSSPERFAADAAVVSDTRIAGPDRPAITYALRGAIGMEVEVEAGPRDLHAGAFGGAAANPLEALCRLAGSLHDARGGVAVPGFDRGVRTWPPAERAFMARHGPSDGDVRRAAGRAPGGGEPGYSLYERTTIRPALTVTGVVGGHTGSGAGAVIPRRAVAKLNVRLVPDQDPRQVAAAIRTHLGRLVPEEMRARVRVGSASPPVVVDRRHPVVLAAARACRRGFGADPVLLRSGGTIPVVEILVHRLRLPVALLGMALPDDGMHAPNEKANLPTLHRGAEAMIWFLHELGRLRGKGRTPDVPPATLPEEVGVQ
jgi:acetylornithine deacetylase/succinyl-diaminopimelate desuccinylase-like protein